jgi:dTDP-4-dehydrorhamnose reductase
VNSVLSCAKLAETFGVHMPEWQHALDLVLDSLQECAPKS